MADELPEKVTGSGPINPAKPVASGQEEGSKPNTSFQQHMDSTSATPAEQGGATQSPMDIARAGASTPVTPSMETLQGQMNSTSGVLGDIQKQLQTKNLKLKPSQKYLLRNKLGESNKMIRNAAEKLGVHTGDPVSTLSRQNPIARFINLVQDGQTQLEAAQHKISALGKGGHIEPAQLLTVQIKLSKAQQELEYSSVLLSKAVEDVKTLFNIQI